MNTKPKGLKFWIGLVLFVGAIITTIGRMCVATGLPTPMTAEEQATNIAANATRTAFNNASYDFCQITIVAQEEFGGYEIRIAQMTDGIFERDCNLPGYERKSIRNLEQVTYDIENACKQSVVKADEYKLSVKMIDINWAKIPCVDILADHGLTRESTLATGKGILIPATVKTQGMEFYYYSLRGNGALVLNQEGYPTWIYNGTLLHYVDETHAKFGEDIVETAMMPYIALSTLTQTDCYPRPTEGTSYRWRSLSDPELGPVILYDEAGNDIGAVPPIGQLMEFGEEANGYIHVYHPIYRGVYLKTDEVSCRP
jgi:hypothetical protein